MGIRAKVAPLFANLRTSNLADRWTARLTARKPRATGLMTRPEPRTIGSFARGKQLIAGNYQFGGHLVQSPGRDIWAVDAPDLGFETELHGFTWLDDLAAVGDSAARELAQEWMAGWIARYGKGTGPGWSPDLTGRRVIRWINNAVFLTNAQDKAEEQRFLSSVAHQTSFLARRWKAASPGLPRFEALTGLLYAGLSLKGMDRHVFHTIKALGHESAEQIDAHGGMALRNPEELMEILTLLTWASAALSDAGQTPDPAHLSAIERIVPTLRALRHADGGLARFHGGGRGAEGRLDQALAQSGVKAVAREGLAMGYLRLQCGRSTVLADVSPPPPSVFSYNAHASTLSFELTSGRREVIVGCGAGTPFGLDWQRASRATASHSTMVVDGHSSSVIDFKANPELIRKPPGRVTLEHRVDEDGAGLTGSHDGYVKAYGLTHLRKMDLSYDGRVLGGEDTLACMAEAEKVVFERYMDANALQGVPYALRFHLHPNVEAELDLGGTAVSLTLKSGEIWVFKADGQSEIVIEPSVYLQKGRLRPRAAKQIVLSGRVMEYATQVGWSLAKAQETPSYMRDVADELKPTLK